jgi:tocopherol O-methyltransferase
LRCATVSLHVCRHIARKFKCRTNGITLSPKQAQRGNELAAAEGLTELCHFEVADALHQPYEDERFDFVWSMESGEHMPDKQYVPFTRCVKV